MGSLIGYVAAFCTTAAFVPQALKVYKGKQTKDISLSMFLLLTTGLALWIYYGVMVNSLPIIFANTITIILAAYILVMKFKLDVLFNRDNYPKKN